MTDREIIVALAEQVFGWRVFQLKDTVCSHGKEFLLQDGDSFTRYKDLAEWRQMSGGGSWNPLADYNDTFEVLGKFDYWRGGHNSKNNGHWMSLGDDPFHPWVHNDADFRRAVCIAALAAKGVKV